MVATPGRLGRNVVCGSSVGHVCQARRQAGL